MSTPVLNILFVDDDPAVLAGLDRKLQLLDERWNARYSLDAAAALAELEREGADVVVTDLRMPGIDGVQLLEKVRALSPATVRLALSEPGDQAAALYALPVAHEVLSKPCDIGQLQQAVSRDWALQKRLYANGVIQAVGALRSLPSLPRLYWELTRELASDNGDARSVAAIIEQDMAMTARILQLVNSSFFGLGRRVNAVRDAVGYLGFETVRSLVLQMQAFRAISDICLPSGFSLEKMQNHSLQVGRIAADLLQDKELKRIAFSAALLHDLGSAVLAVSMPKAYQEAQQRAAAHDLRLLDTEQAVFGCTHAEVGGHLLSLWGLPLALVEAVAYHHQPALLSRPGFGVTADYAFFEGFLRALSISHNAVR